MKRTIQFFILMPFLWLTGCADQAQMLTLPTGEIVSASTSRFGSWERVAIKQADVRKAKYEARKEEASSHIQAATTWNLSTEASQALFVSHQALQTVSQTNQRLVDVIEVIAGGGESQDYTPMPKGAFAEFLDSAGNFAGTILNSAGGKLGIGLLAGAEVLDRVGQNSGDRVNTDGGDVSDSLNDREDHMTGNGAGSSMVVESPPTSTITDVVQ